MSEAPLISLILPVYNVEEYLPKCMESVFNQSYQNLEIILIDDGSKQKCADLCEEYAKKDSRVIVYHKKNGGLSDARNYGIEKAKGEYISCIDPDDYIDSDYISYLYRLITIKDYKMSVCQHRVVFQKGKTIDYGDAGYEVLKSKECIERLLYDDVIDTSAWAKLYKKSLFENIEYPVGKSFEDIATTYKLMMSCDEIIVGYESKYNYVMRSNSIVNETFNIKKLDLIENTDAMGNNVIKRFPDFKNAILRRRVYARFSTLNQMLNVDGYNEIRKGIIDFIRLNGIFVLRDKKAPIRDKIAIILLMLSYPLYKFSWSVFKKIAR